MIRIAIPSYRKVEDFNESYTAFNIEVYASGRIHNVEKRYSEFEDVHKQLKKFIQTPEFPPKKVLRWNTKVLEQRRQGLQNYLQGILQGETVPKAILRFLDVTLITSGSEESLDQFGQENTLSHQPTIGFPHDAFLQDNYRSSLPDIIVEGVHSGLYSNSMDDINIR